MIIHWWRAVAGTEEVLAQYAKPLKRETFVDIAELPGHLGAALALKVNGDANELVVTSLWSDLDVADHVEQGAFDDAVAKSSTQKPLKSSDVKVAYFETVVDTDKLAA
jgi:heme-degrading monooxygenase HmoA